MTWRGASLPACILVCIQAIGVPRVAAQHFLLNHEFIHREVRPCRNSGDVFWCGSRETHRYHALWRSPKTNCRALGSLASNASAASNCASLRPTERARRRFEELQSRGEPTTFDEVLAQQEVRDERDATRPVGALLKAADAVEVCTDGLTLEQVVERLEGIVHERVQGSGFRVQ